MSLKTVVKIKLKSNENKVPLIIQDNKQNNVHWLGPKV